MPPEPAVAAPVDYGIIRDKHLWESMRELPDFIRVKIDDEITALQSDPRPPMIQEITVNGIQLLRKPFIIDERLQRPSSLLYKVDDENKSIYVITIEMFAVTYFVRHGRKAMSANLTSLWGMVDKAIKAVPAVRYALGIAGIMALIAIIRAFGLDYRIATLGTVVMLVLMVALVVFARLSQMASSASRYFLYPVLVFLWAFLILTILTAIMLFTSVFWNIPLNLRDIIVPPPSSRAVPKSDIDFNWVEIASEFYISQRPITNAQYKDFMDVKDYKTPRFWQNSLIPSGKEGEPVVGVSWHVKHEYA